jgi:hypothetical protein
MTEKTTKKPIYKELAAYLGVTEAAIKRYNVKKRELMILGLWEKKEQEARASQSSFKG